MKALFETSTFAYNYIYVKIDGKGVILTKSLRI